MKFSVVAFHPVAAWKWDTSSDPHKLYRHAPRPSDDPSVSVADDDDEEDDDLCGICQTAFEACCPECKVPGDDCPLIWGECTHVFHMHCLLKWIGTESSKQQCPLDRRPWATADRKPDRLPTTTTGVPVPHLPQGLIPGEVVQDANSSRPDESFSSARTGERGVQPTVGGVQGVEVVLIGETEAEVEDEDADEEEMDIDAQA